MNHKLLLSRTQCAYHHHTLARLHNLATISMFTRQLEKSTWVYLSMDPDLITQIRRHTNSHWGLFWSQSKCILTEGEKGYLHCHLATGSTFHLKCITYILLSMPDKSTYDRSSSHSNKCPQKSTNMDLTNKTADQLTLRADLSQLKCVFTRIRYTFSSTILDSGLSWSISSVWGIAAHSKTLDAMIVSAIPPL